MLAEAYFDESGTNDDSRNLCLGGYVFEGASIAAFEDDWQEMLRRYELQYFHMREFNQQRGKGVYGHLSTPARQAALGEAIGIIERHALCGFAFSVEKTAFDDIAAGSPWSKQYAFLANQAFYGIEETFKHHGPGSVNYVFEQGAHGWGNAAKVFQEAKAIPALKDKYRLGELRQEPKSGAIHLQAADLLVWSTLRERRRVDRGEPLGSHEEFNRLRGVKLHVHHWDSEAGEIIQWLRNVVGRDTAFMEWLQMHATREFLLFLRADGQNAVDYFRSVFRASR
ncbi:DUF3800 domain-containing protein [uncultured Aquincola sp.]|uniref:DUF3800 domain-containing protein n=1 Tax=uncultured Aquincola sp. TaxID=886556 RepID=UPI0032B264E6|tara:strand:+ start:168 stop:1013 length:846 start_codon:yes stop_codon:yes gene_type:complete